MDIERRKIYLYQPNREYMHGYENLVKFHRLHNVKNFSNCLLEWLFIWESIVYEKISRMPLGVMSKILYQSTLLSL
jgi:hypothetical protein